MYSQVNQGVFSVVIQYGRSGVENDLLDLAKQKGFTINDISEIDLILKDVERQYDEKKPLTYDKIKSEISELHNKIENTKNNIELNKAQILEDIKKESNDLKTESHKLQAVEFDLKHLFHYFSSKLKLRRCNKRLYDLETDVDSEINKRLDNLYSSIKLWERKYYYLEANPNREVESRLSHLVSQIHSLNEIKNSKIYKGALGELAVIENLCNLSDKYYLFNDLYLELNDYIKFKGSFLKSAQIDHLIIGPTGVFVIETKNWSNRYVQSVFNDGSYTPYDQIQRSSYLVYRYLNSNKYGGKLQKVYYHLAEDEVKVKSIIAVVGSKIPYEKNGFIRVLSHNAISTHIEKSKCVLNDASINEIASKWHYKY